MLAAYFELDPIRRGGSIWFAYAVDKFLKLGALPMLIRQDVMSA